MEPLNTGLLTVELYTGGRYTSTRVSLRCDAIAIDGATILFVSAVGPESSVKSIRACLQSGPDGRSAFSARFDGESVAQGYLHHNNLNSAEQKYRCQTHQILPGLWHLVAVARVPGFMPVMSDDALWQELQSERYTVPLLREWMPYIKGRLELRKFLVDIKQVGCNASLLKVDDGALEAILHHGINGDELKIPGESRPKSSKDFIAYDDSWPKDLDGYMLRYGGLLGKQAERSLNPLHVPGRDALVTTELMRQPFEAQAHVIAATAKAMRRQRAVMVVAEMGTGKTIISMASIHEHAAGQPYRTLVFCPGQLTAKWEREIVETIPGATVRQIETWKDLLDIDRTVKPAGPEWWVIARDRAKLGSRWSPAFQLKLRADKDGNVNEYLTCPSCGGVVVDDQGDHIEAGALGAKRHQCEFVRAGREQQLAKGCGSALWQMNRELWRYEPALYIKRRLKRYFDYLILDEVHETKGSDTAQGNASGALASACKKTIALTGTLIGGYAEHIRPLLFRLSPQSLVNEGLVWDNQMPFSERYGRIDTTITEKSGGPDNGDDNRESRGKANGKSVRKSVRPGIMPALFGRHLIDKAVFLSLSEVADNLPELNEELVAVPMDQELAAEYKRVEDELTAALKEMIVRGDKRLLGKMLQTLLCYPDLPVGWGPIGYQDGDVFVTVTEPADLDTLMIRPKEQALIDLVLAEKAAGRQCWVFVQYTDKHDVQGRLDKLLKDADLRVGVLRSSVSLAKREEWIARNGPKLDVVISHPKLVETGLDLFDKGGRHNFPTLVFYETGYNLFTLRQASRRSWRIGQTLPCRVVYLFYEKTMQARAMALMGKKLAASQALEGKFSTEGLVAMGGEEGSVEVALARSLVNNMDEGDVRRVWAKIGGAVRKDEPEPDDDPPPMNGGSLLDLMRKNKVGIKSLAERLGVSQYRVRKARMVGLAGADVPRWTAAIQMPVVKMPRRKAAVKTARRAA